MMNFLKNRRLNIIMLFGAIVLLWVAIAVVVGPPDEAPPFITPGP
ncbi:MAG: hypothetical protein ACTSO7_07360 [Candidatus Heimdallarchaeota archaeon]